MQDLSDFYCCVAGVTLCGWRLDDGTIRLGGDQNSGRIVKEFPKELKVGDNIYTLEDVITFANKFVNAEYM